MSLVKRLLEESDDAGVQAPVVPPTDRQVELTTAAPAVQAEPKTAAEKDAKEAAAMATKFAGAIQTQLEKVASEGDPGEGGELRKTLSKCAFYINELLAVKTSQDKRVEFLLKEAEDVEGLRTYREAVKLAGELIAQGRIEAPEDYDIDKIAETLMKEDLRVVKKASEFADAGKLGNLGKAADKTEITSYGGTSDDGSRARADDKSFVDAHGFLLSGRA